MTDKQVRRLFALGKVETNLETAAAKAGMDAKTARKYRRLGRVPSELTPETAMADTRGLLSGGLGRSAEPAGGEPRAGSENDL